jgi:hypothetical protein
VDIPTSIPIAIFITPYILLSKGKYIITGQRYKKVDC